MEVNLKLSSAASGATAALTVGLGIGLGIAAGYALQRRRGARQDSKDVTKAPNRYAYDDGSKLNGAQEEPTQRYQASRSRSGSTHASAYSRNNIVAPKSDRYGFDDDFDLSEMEQILSDFRTRYKSWRESHQQNGPGPHRRSLPRNTSRSGGVDSLRRLQGEPAPPTADLVHLWDSNRRQRTTLGANNQPPIKVTVIGGGAFGTSMATTAARNGHNVVLWVRKQHKADTINESRENKEYLPGMKLPENLVATCDLQNALKDTQLIIHALPAQSTPQFISENLELFPPKAIFCSTAKGLYLEKNCLLSIAIKEAFGPNRDQTVALLSGPSFAAEIMKGDPTAVVVAAHKLADAVFIQRVMSSVTFRVYASQDTVGVELGGALKNPLAVGAGIIQGLGFGVNTMSAYISRSCAELTELCVAMGGDPATIAGLAGVGDLMLTAFGSLSRNRKCGIRLVQGESLADILQTSTVEGIPTARVAVAFADQCNLTLPIFHAVASVIDGKLEPENFILTALMDRPLTAEHLVA